MSAYRFDSTRHTVIKRFMALAQLIRLPNLFTAVSNIVAAHLVATAGDVQWQTLTLSLLASLSFYHGGMVLNDCFDITEDSRLRPSRPLPSGLIPLRVAWCLGVALLLVGLILSYHLGMSTFVVGCALAAMIIAYNASRRDRLEGCVAIGACRFLNWCLALTAVGQLLAFWPYAMLVGIYVAALTIISRDETDAQHPYWVNYCAVAMLVGGLVFVVSLATQGQLQLFILPVVVFGLGLILWRLWKLRQDYRPQHIQATVMFFVLGLIPLDASLVLISGQPLLAVLVLALIYPSRHLARRFYVT